MSQPWATLVAIGQNRIETRSWNTHHRGRLAIHCAKAFPSDARKLCLEQPYRAVLIAAGYADPSQLPLGVIIAVCDLESVMAFDGASLRKVRKRTARGEFPPHEADFGDFSPGRFGFVLRDVRRLACPVPAKGMLGIWQLPNHIEDEIRMAELES